MKTNKVKRIMFVMTERYAKLTKAILTLKTFTSTVAPILFELWMAYYSILSRPLIYNSLSFVSWFFLTPCSTLWVNNITTSVDYPQTSGQAECFSTLMS